MLAGMMGTPPCCWVLQNSLQKREISMGLRLLFFNPLKRAVVVV
jgi:hypothetical protein